MSYVVSKRATGHVLRSFVSHLNPYHVSKIKGALEACTLTACLRIGKANIDDIRPTLWLLTRVTIARDFRRLFESGSSQIGTMYQDG